MEMENLIDFIFERSLEMPDDFYLGIMNVIKNNHENTNINGIHAFLDKHGSRISPELLQEIKNLIPGNEMSIPLINEMNGNEIGNEMTGNGLIVVRQSSDNDMVRYNRLMLSCMVLIFTWGMATFALISYIREG
jgi:hypothetical protein